jgi:hypothetical protein
MMMMMMIIIIIIIIITTLPHHAIPPEIKLNPMSFTLTQTLPPGFPILSRRRCVSHKEAGEIA